MVIENTPAAWDARAAASSSHAAGLQSEYAQTQRFLAVLRRLDLTVGSSLLDFGCGTGALAEYVSRRLVYYGVDWSDAMVDRARAEWPSSRDRQRYFLTAVPGGAPFDHVVAVGTFNLAHGWSKEKTEAKVQELWERTRRTLVVSLLRERDRGDAQDGNVLRYSPGEVHGWAEALGGSRFEVDTSHLDNDLILAVYR